MPQHELGPVLEARMMVHLVGSAVAVRSEGNGVRACVPFVPKTTEAASHRIGTSGLRVRVGEVIA